MSLLFVVHRYPPYRGGSEYYVQQMAEESLKRGYTVSVFTNDHMGDLNGVRVTSDSNILDEPFDLIIVHGGGCNNQNHYGPGLGIQDVAILKAQLDQERRYVGDCCNRNPAEVNREWDSDCQSGCEVLPLSCCALIDLVKAK